MPKLTDQQRETCRNSDRIIRNLDALMAYAPFQAFMARFQSECDELAGKILHDPMTHDERENIRQRRLGILEVLRTPMQDRADALLVLSNCGIKPGQTDEDLNE